MTTAKENKLMNIYVFLVQKLLIEENVIMESHIVEFCRMIRCYIKTVTEQELDTPMCDCGMEEETVTCFFTVVNTM